MKTKLRFSLSFMMFYFLFMNLTKASFDKKSALLRQRLHGSNFVPSGIKSRLKFYLSSDPNSVGSTVLKYPTTLSFYRNKGPELNEVSINDGHSKLRYAMNSVKEDDDEKEALIKTKLTDYSIEQPYSQLIEPQPVIFWGMKSQKPQFLPRPPLVL